jgi:hypothetical protein
MEIWKDIEGFDGYQVSNMGNLISYKRSISVIMKPYKSKKTHYYQIRMVRNDGESKTLYVHRLVALTFIPNPNGYKEVNHINPITKDFCDNSVSNLEWCTKSTNMKHRALCGNQMKQILSMDDAEKIRELYKTGNYTQKQLADMFNYKQPNISTIISNKIW